jgi:hypothetical protein
MVLLSGCIGARGGSPAASAALASDMPSASATSTPSPSPDDAPARAPVHHPPWTDAGSMATVLTPRLAVRDFAGGIFDKLTELRTGTEVFVAFGPLANEGLDWYEVVFTAIAGDPDNWGDSGRGWVAAGPTGADTTSLRIDPPRCPDQVTAAAIGPMSTLTRLQCLGTDSYELSGVIRGCTDYFETQWLMIQCVNLGTEHGTVTDLYLHFPPELVAPETHEGDIVRLVGHVDDPRASKCHDGVSTEPPIPPALVDAWSVLNCRGSFVVTELAISERVEG